MDKELEKLEEATFFEEDFPEVPPPEIVAYNELRSCADLYRMHIQKIIDIQPEFQREIVWNGPAQTRFIDSLIKQLPIPSMCFAMDHKQQRWIVIDGLQRMSTILRFLRGGDWRLSELADVDQKIAGKSVAAIKDENTDLHHFYTRVENLSIPITVLRCDFNKKSHLDYLFTIFHRLNTGGVKLNNQEIRNCIYGGSLNKALKEMDNIPTWRTLNKMKHGTTYRFTKQEIILRFLAFVERFENYNGHLAKFLNDFMQKHRNAEPGVIAEQSAIFERTVNCVTIKIFDAKSPKKIPITLLEGLLVGVGRNINFLDTISSDDIKIMYNKLLRHPDFSEGALTEGLSKKPKVIERLNVAVQVFSRI